MAEQAPTGTETPWRRDPGELGPRLATWASERLGTEVDVPEVEAPGNGMSSDTVLFTMQRADTGVRERYVARLAPPPSLHPVFPEYDLDLQRRCMELVAAHTTVPVPHTPWYETDPEWLGAPFLVMDRIDGIVPTDNPPYVFGGWLMDASPEDRARLQRSSVDVLARLHEITVGAHDLAFLARPEHGATALDQHLGYQRWYYEWAREGVAYPLIERTFAWLEAHRPHEGPTVLNWGDGRIGNMLYRDFEPVAVLDWEMAAVGPAEIDVAWMIFLHRFFQDLAERFEMPGLPGFMTASDVCARYESRTGYAATDLHWYEVFGALRFAIVSVRTSTRGIAYGQMDQPADPDDLIMFRALLERMIS